MKGVTVTPGRFELGTDGPSLILVGIDGSRTSVRAGAYAAGLARRQGCPLAVVHVRRASVGNALDVGAGVAVAASQLSLSEDLERQVRQGAQYAGVTARFYTADGDPFTQLSRLAAELRADAVVVGASESAGHRLVGSLAARLVRAGRWPVTVVP